MDEQIRPREMLTELYLLRKPRQSANPTPTLLTKRLKGDLRRPFLMAEEAEERGEGGLRTTAKSRGSRSSDPLARFEYMFGGPHAGLLVLRGWKAILAAACDEIEQLVAVRRLQFHWVSLQEEDGAGRFIYAVNDSARFMVDLHGKSRRAFTQVSGDLSSVLTRRLDAVACEAERLTLEACVVCGARCVPERYFGHQLPLCQRHKPELLSESTEVGLEGVWRRAVDRDVAPRAPWV